LEPSDPAPCYGNLIDKPPVNITEEEVKPHFDIYYLFKQQLTERMENIDE
jgi:hypothetical protein